MELTDSAGNTICGVRSPQNNEKLPGRNLHLPLRLKLEDTISTDFLLQGHLPAASVYICCILSIINGMLLVTFSAIYAQLRPLLKLKEQMELVMSGNLNAEVATTNSRDEISSLSRTFNNMVNEISHLINEIQVTQKRESELRFEMLLAQINPHFLFNTLNSIKWMSVVSGTDHITTTITSLGRLLEISMNKVNDVLPLGEELENIRSYIQIQQVRYPGRLMYFTI